jgi:magnesium and cobalt exporter, CNNM family
MDPLQIILLALLPVLLLASVAFSASETALFSLSQADRLRLRKTHPRTHAAVVALLSAPRALLISILLANTSVNTAYFAVAAVVGTGLRGRLAPVLFGVSALLAMVIVGEVLPKSIAALHRDFTCRVLARPLLAWHRLLAPVRRMAEGIVLPLSRLLRPAGRGEAEPLTPEELSALLEVGGRLGALEESEQRMLEDVVNLGEVRIRDVMTPRVSIQSLEAGGTTHDLLELVRETGRTKFPLCRGGLDEGQILGFVSTQRALPLFNKHGPAVKLPLVPLAEPVRYMPERARLDQLLEHFRSTRSDIAMCVNEGGELTGMVEIDDVIRELVTVSVGGVGGEPGADDQVRMVELGKWEVPGRLSIRDWAEFFGRQDLSVDRAVSTVAGLILTRLGRVPQAGDEVRVRNLKLRVEAMSGRVIEKVSVSLIQRAAFQSDPTGAAGRKGDAA